MKFTLKTAKLEADLMTINGQHVRVGVLNKSKKELRPRRPLEKGLLTSPAVGDETGKTVPINKGTTAGRQRNERIAKVAEYLNESVGLFDKALARAGNKDINEITQYFVDLVLTDGPTEGIERRLENLCRSIVRNPMINKELGPNAESTAKAKGFNHYGVNTGTLFKNIEAKYGRG